METKANFEYLKYIAETADKRAILAELMDAYGNDLWNFAYILTKDVPLSNRVAQDVFVAVYEQLLSCRAASDIRSWLLAKTRAAAIAQKKSARIRQALSIGLFSRARTDQGEPQEARPSSDLWRLVLKLPLKFREVVVLHSHYQCPPAEIANILGVSEPEMKARLYKARIKLLQLKEHESVGTEQI